MVRFSKNVAKNTLGLRTKLMLVDLVFKETMCQSDTAEICEEIGLLN